MLKEALENPEQFKGDPKYYNEKSDQFYNKIEGNEKNKTLFHGLASELIYKQYQAEIYGTMYPDVKEEEELLKKEEGKEVRPGDLESYAAEKIAKEMAEEVIA